MRHKPFVGTRERRESALRDVNQLLTRLVLTALRALRALWALWAFHLNYKSMINLSVDSHRSSVIEAQFSSLQILQFIFLKSLDCTRINSTTQGYVFIYINMVEQTGLNIVFCLGNVTHASPVTASREHDNSAHLVSVTCQAPHHSYWLGTQAGLCLIWLV